jgi:uncharacterized membrane protein YfcA
MMNIYLPIADQSVMVWALFAVGGGVGMLSGVFGIGGGFLMTPLLMFLGIPPTVAVGTGVVQVMGSSTSAVIAHWRRRNVDVRIGTLMLVGGLFGGGLAVWLFALLKQAGQANLVIFLIYVVSLCGIGSVMLVESVKALLSAKSGKTPTRKTRLAWHAWPLRMRFPRSHLYISALPPLLLGVIGGMLATFMGGGGGFLMVPLMIYTLGMPTAVVIGTSLFQIIFVTSGVTLMQAMTTHTVDVVLALMLLVGGVIGAQIGARIGAKLRADQLRLLLALIVLSVGVEMAWKLIHTPHNLFSLAS